MPVNLLNIKTPTMAQNFALSFMSGLTLTEFELLQANIVLALIEANPVSPHILTLWFEEPEEEFIGVLLNSLLNKKGTIFIQLDNFDMAGKRIQVKKFAGCKTTKVTYALAYAKNETCKYMVTFDVDKIDFA